MQSIVTTQNIKPATKVLFDFLDDQVKDKDLDEATALAIATLHADGKLTKTNLLRQLEEVRKAEFKGDRAESA